MLMASKAERHVAILGDMFELGDDSVELHRSVGTYAVGVGLELLITMDQMLRRLLAQRKMHLWR